MGKIMEAIFCVFYLIFTAVVGVRTLQHSEGKQEYKLFGILTLVLVGGDAFHLVPRILSAVNPTGNYAFALGYGKMVTSITMTFFYLLLYRVYELRYDAENKNLRTLMIVLSALRVLLCLLPQNDWAGADPVFWGVVRNIPFTVMGILTVVLFYKKKDDPAYKWMWLAVTLSFAFYLPVVLWADVSPMIGMLMMPKTIMYMWAAVMGYKAASKKL